MTGPGPASAASSEGHAKPAAIFKRAEALVVDRARTDEQYRRDLKAALQSLGRRKPGRTLFANVFLHQRILTAMEIVRFHHRSESGRLLSIKKACVIARNYLLRDGIDRDVGTIENVYLKMRRQEK